jgi:hypothetical protein
MLGKYPVFPPTDEEFLDPPGRDEYDVVIVGPAAPATTGHSS